MRWTLPGSGYEKGRVVPRVDHLESVGCGAEPRQECGDIAALRLRAFVVMQAVHARGQVEQVDSRSSPLRGELLGRRC